MGAIESFLLIFTNYPSLLSFFGALFGGEETILFLASLSGQGIIPLWKLFLFSYLGLMVADSIWFWVAKLSFFSNLKRHPFLYKNYVKTKRFLHEYSHNNELLLLFSTKFVYGIRIAVIMYLSRYRLHFSRFLLYNALVDLMWVTIVVFIGWSAGRGVSYFLDIYNGLIVSVSILVIAFLVFYLLKGVISKWLLKK